MHLSRLRAGDGDPQDLVFRNRASKRLDAYTQGTYTVSALLRYRDHSIEKNPGQDVRYIVVDDNARQPDRVRLPFEEPQFYDAELYPRELVRAAESIVSPRGWDRDDIRRYFREYNDVKLEAFQ